VRLPSYRNETIRFAPDTPYETLLSRPVASGERVLTSELAEVVRDAMADVVENGTGRRAAGAVRGADGVPLRIGAKTGTGNNRFRVYGRAGQIVEDRAINRTSTVVFYIGDRFFGTLTAFVSGAAADDYDFTSSLPAQILRLLGPALSELVADPPT
jgi:membrane peptidoglycan carboxypeptidase